MERIIGIIAESSAALQAQLDGICADPERTVGVAKANNATRLLLRRASRPAIRVLTLNLTAGGIAVLPVQRGLEEPMLRDAIELGGSACCLIGSARAGFLRAIAATFGTTWMEPERNTVRAEEPALTVRERQVLQLMTKGQSNLKIAQTLSCAPSTVHTHVMNVFDKLGVRDRVSAAVYAVREGLISENSA